MTTRTEREFAKNTGYMQGVGDEVRLHLFNLADRVDKLTAERDAAEEREYGEQCRKDIIALVAKVHAAKGRYHSQIAMCDLYDACNLPNERPKK